MGEKNEPLAIMYLRKLDSSCSHPLVKSVGAWVVSDLKFQGCVGEAEGMGITSDGT